MIGIIDSGYGGLSVVKELILQDKQLPFVYFGDNARNPYGTKTKTEILKCSQEIIDYLIDDYQIESLIIACNTICAACLPDLQEKYPSLHIEAITNYGSSAALMSFNEHVTVLATKFTIESNIYQNLIHQFDEKIKVQQIIAQDFVKMVETNDINQNEIKHVMNQIDLESDMLILGCTHFPFLYPYIRKEVSEDIQIIDPAVTCVASLNLTPIKDWKSGSLFITSEETTKFNTFLQFQELSLNIPIKQKNFNEK